MRLTSYDDGRGRRSALQRHADDNLIDIAALATLSGDHELGALAGDVQSLLNAGPGLAPRLLDLAEKHQERLREQGAVISPASVTFLPPVARPEKIICIGLNYHDHVAETGQQLPKEPIFFGKFANSLIGHGAIIVPPRVTQQVDYEAELAVVIGLKCFDVPASAALDFVAGVMPLNDVSARDLQLSNQLWTSGKAIDTFAPCGPALVLLDEIADVQNLPITARVNGNTVQDSNTAQMIFSVADLVEFMSRIMTLVPGDIIATGTPAGVARAHGPMTFLNRGDVVDIDIAGIGVLSNPIGEPLAASRYPQAATAVS